MSTHRLNYISISSLVKSKSQVTHIRIFLPYLLLNFCVPLILHRNMLVCRIDSLKKHLLREFKLINEVPKIWEEHGSTARFVRLPFLALFVLLNQLELSERVSPNLSYIYDERSSMD